MEPVASVLSNRHVAREDLNCKLLIQCPHDMHVYERHTGLPPLDVLFRLLCGHLHPVSAAYIHFELVCMHDLTQHARFGIERYPG